MGKLKASEQKEFRYISIAQLISHSTQQYLKDNIGGHLNKIEGRGGALIVSAATILAAKHGITEMGGALKGGKLRGVTMRTVHK